MCRFLFRIFLPFFRPENLFSDFNFWSFPRVIFRPVDRSNLFYCDPRRLLPTMTAAPSGVAYLLSFWYGIRWPVNTAGGRPKYKYVKIAFAPTSCFPLWTVTYQLSGFVLNIGILRSKTHMSCIDFRTVFFFFFWLLLSSNIKYVLLIRLTSFIRSTIVFRNWL